MAQGPKPGELESLRDKVKKRLQNIPGKEFNVLVVGMYGSGKSSFINSMVMAVTGTWHEYAHYANAPYLSVTKRLERYVMFDDKCKEEDEKHSIPGYRKNVIFWDCPGFPDASEEAYSTIVSLTLDGRIPPGTKVLEFINQSPEQLRNKFGRVNRKMTFDRIVYINSADCDVHKLLVTAIKSGAQKDHDIPIFAMMTKIDKADDLQKRVEDAQAALTLTDNNVRFKTTSLYCKDVTACTDPNDYRVMMPNPKIDSVLLNTWMNLTDPNIRVIETPPPHEEPPRSNIWCVLL
ncbi:uncharacterized protein LOC118430768 [Branchiostoma floridae]|uniref:Uncharacterized protein LOC118430768 n=1 Tax=Branchiostoma floridae TaxID=7739 RepID=C3XPZ5_BRAFL|nr:uncharacterized protein LOC118430768 [Branchiostoma floridae]|eukprot:XP_002614007.1 hypothetical protein BRAFLDRAFT_67409 [Branchiostoma floridae]